MSHKPENKPEVEYNLSQNEMTEICNKTINNIGLKNCMVCLATHVKTGELHYVLFQNRLPIYTSQSSESIAIRIDLMKFGQDCDERDYKEGKTNDKKISRSSNGNMPHRLRNNNSRRR